MGALFYWRRRWDSNPRAVAGKLISSQPRYDHFDTSPIGPLHYNSNDRKNQALLFDVVKVSSEKNFFNVDKYFSGSTR